MEQLIMDDFTLLSKEELVKKKKMALLFSINSHVSQYSEITDDLLDVIEVDNENIGKLKNCFYIDTTNGECFAVIAPHELKDYVLEYMKENCENYAFSFGQISQITNSSKDEVESYFLHHILSNHGTVSKRLDEYYVEGEGVNEFCTYKNQISMEEYLEKYIVHIFSLGEEKDLLLEDYSVIKGLYVIFIG